MNVLVRGIVLSTAVSLVGLAGGQAAGTARGAGQGSNTALDSPAAQGQGKGTGTAGEAPLDAAGAQGAGDASALASPVVPLPRGTAIAVGSDIRMTLVQGVSSGTQMNGDKIHGTLAAPVRTTSGAVLPRGTVVDGTVVSSAKAGLVTSGGILSLQLTRVGGVAVITDVVDFNGQEGHKDVADSAPTKGSEAAVASGTVLDFHVLEVGHATGLVPGVKPAAGAGENQNGGAGSAPVVGPGVPTTPIHGATQGVTPR